MNYTKEEYISLLGKDALYIQKSIHNTGKLSYFGGYPTLPKQLTWPTTIYEGKKTQLPFLAQINLIDLPGDNKYLPKMGVLYFFYDISFEEHQHPSPTCVLYSKEVNDKEAKPSKELLPSFNNDLMMTGLFLYRHPDILYVHPRDCYPKNEVSFFKYKDINNPIHEYTENIENFSFFDEQKIERKKLISKSIDTNFAYQEKNIHPSIHNLIDRDKLPNWLVGQLEYKSEKIKESPFAKDWPQSWFHIEVFCHEFKKGLSKNKGIVKVDDELLNFLMITCENWLSLAQSSVHSEKVPLNNALEFRDWIFENYLKALNTTSNSNASSTIRFSIESSVSSFMFATNWLFDLNDSGVSVFSENQIEIIDQYRKESAHNPHQILGYGERNDRLEYEEVSYEDSILLLQLSWDDTILWSFGDLSTLQFRISKESLKALRFEDTTMALIY